MCLPPLGYARVVMSWRGKSFTEMTLLLHFHTFVLGAWFHLYIVNVCICMYIYILYNMYMCTQSKAINLFLEEIKAVFLYLKINILIGT